MAHGPTGGALSREYHTLRRIVGVAVRQSIVCRLCCRRNGSEVCTYVYVYFHVCVCVCVCVCIYMCMYVCV